MELEFDKEIDAILRKTRAGGASTAIRTPHIDADAIAAFAENALPEKTRALYFEHFADCDRCRGSLAQAAAWPPAETNAASIAAPTVAVSAPWYSGIFRMRGLAMAMGLLVLALGGVLGFLVIKRSANSGATVAGVMNTSQRADGLDTAPSDVPVAAANSIASNAASNSANTVPLAETQANKPASAAVSPGVRGPAEDAPAPTADEEPSADGSLASSAKQKEAVPPPPAAKSQPPADDEKRKDDADKAEEGQRGRETKTSARSEAVTTDSISRDGAPQAMKKVGPSRPAAGPRQSNVQNQGYDLGQNAVGGAATTGLKNAGGKKFENKDGVWYDTAYHGQATKNFRRSSDEYKKLDSGLRSIASSIGGVVVVVWKGTAYRIQ